MIDISQQELKFNCPECKAENTVTLQQVAKEETVVCAGCGKGIGLKDEDGKTQKTIASIDEQMDNLNNTLKKFGQ